MRLLLDTHVVLWELGGVRTVGPVAQQAIESADELLFSVVSFAEVGIKAATGKLVVPDDFHEQVLRSGLRILGLAPGHGLGVAVLPMHHRDPFDRLLIAQARLDGLTLMTDDERIADYELSLIDARS
jgi:PIN domain nuclease of toxin-antitoxin system